MFKFSENCNPTKISLTGVRAIVLLAFLSQKPRTFEEINEFFVNSNFVSKDYSQDTIRIDLNTLKYAGCEISKATKSTGNAFVLKSHPFQLNLDETDLETLSKIYKAIYKNLSVERLLDYDDLFQKLADAVKEPEIKEYLLGISIFKGLDIKLIRELLADTKRNSRLTMKYNAGNSTPVEYDITAENLGLRNGKLYIYCFNHTLNKRTFLNVSRIKEVLFRCLRGDKVESDDIVMKFKLNNSNNYNLDENETIIEQNENFVIVQGNYYTEFIAIQRVLSFGSDCTIISPDNLKENLIKKLKLMREQYD